ncbi:MULTISPECIES: precorrin-6A synthase (deacetylating) [unclassified Gordonia (in: high G+C Gram-positive bacteria)]|uniref:precorrin-6A synthase (deacetylating) n=1 Tax=unclassified Gordonia (in: high G+C Gram-positive bacteria) TaxID=2657482 RepID=UPI00071DA5F0|nr:MULTISPECIES: precorrin-6A synthase (deacetylating) [unclassified Gordonia (in: high G+C Gram-positive bacteria)]SCC22014.1 precorrin-6A synthase (deacetylating) [Gordonia sp. v-85]
MRLTLRVIGIGPGGPRQITLQAIDAMADVDAFLALEKGTAKSGLLDARRAILDEYAREGHSLVEIPDPPRDREPADYDAEVRRWHAARAELIAGALRDEVGDGGVAAFLVWGDPALYDSTLRIVDDLAARDDLELEVEVIPGVTSASALTAAHRIVANRVGEPIHTTTGRRLAETPAGADANQIVMLDADLTFRHTADPEDHIWWGAYVGTEDEILISGKVGEVTDRIVEARAEARDRIGWIMDIYLLRKSRQ